MKSSADYPQAFVVSCNFLIDSKLNDFAILSLTIN